MILRDETPAPRRKLTPWLLSIPLGVLMVTVITLAISQPPPSGEAIYACDMEKVIRSSKWTHFVSGDHYFRHGETRTDAEAHSGKYSCVTFDEQAYGIAWNSEDVLAGDYFEISIWRKADTRNGAMVAEGNWGMYLATEVPVISGNNGWEQVKLTFTVPPATDTPRVDVYVYNLDSVPVFWDDLEVRRFRRSGTNQLPDFRLDSVPTLNLLVGEKSWTKLLAARQSALELGILTTGDDDWVPVKLEEGKSQMEGRMRLKGDWTDHLIGQKWSFRVDLDPQYAWKGMYTFSLQSAEARHFLDEWLYHKMLEEEDVLTTRFDFVHVRINGRSLGLYAYEEHFEKQIPESHRRREGPILRFGEEGFWEVMENWKVTGTQKERYMPIFNSATIDAFGMNKVLKDSVLLHEFLVAQNLLEGYRSGQIPITEVFDMDQMAKHFALMDVFQAYHGLIWHNQRYYYNPVTSRLEPVAYDGYTTAGPMLWISRPFLGQFAQMEFVSPGQRDMIYNSLFADKQFMELYVHYLWQYSREDFIRDFLLRMQQDINARQRLIRKEWPSYSFREARISDNAAKLNLLLQPTASTSIKCFTQRKSAAGIQLRAYNYHSVAVKIMGSGKAPAHPDQPLAGDIYIAAYPGELPASFREFEVPAGSKYLFFTIPGLDTLWSVPIIGWPSPNTYSPSRELFADSLPRTQDIAMINNDTVYFPQGDFTSSGDIIIPAGYLVIMEQGFHLDLVKGAKFISRSGILSFGTEEEPVIIRSSDHSAQGFNVIEAQRKSRLRYTMFNHLNNLDYRGWMLTGAVCFYESEVSFENCSFTHNHCEDALNIIRSVFSLSQCEVAYTEFDGFDSDFSRGTVDRCIFHDLGNDGMDFSGSTVSITASTVLHPTDKGVSVGEQSTVELTTVSVVGGNIGLASKDLSKVTIHSMSLDSVKVGFAAYRKKPEYGPASIKVEEYNVGNVDLLFSIEPGSELLLPQEPRRGSR